MLERNLDDARESTAHWARFWGVTWGAVTALQLGGAAVLSNPPIQKSLAVNSAFSVLGLVPTVLYRPAILSDSPSGSDSCEPRADALVRLERYADDDRLRSSWIVYAVAVALNLTRVAILGPGMGQWFSATSGFVVGLPASILMASTYPSAAARLRDSSAREPLAVSAVFSPTAGGGSVGLVVSF